MSNTSNEGKCGKFERIATVTFFIAAVNSACYCVMRASNSWSFPTGEKSRTFRVTRGRFNSNAVAAMTASASLSLDFWRSSIVRSTTAPASGCSDYISCRHNVAANESAVCRGQHNNSIRVMTEMTTQLWNADDNNVFVSSVRIS